MAPQQTLYRIEGHEVVYVLEPRYMRADHFIAAEDVFTWTGRAVAVVGVADPTQTTHIVGHVIRYIPAAAKGYKFIRREAHLRTHDEETCQKCWFFRVD